MKRLLRRWGPWVFMLGTCAATYRYWDGAEVRGLPYEHWIQAVEQGGPNSATARNQLYLRLLDGIRALKADGADRELDKLRYELR